MSDGWPLRGLGWHGVRWVALVGFLELLGVGVGRGVDFRTLQTPMTQCPTGSADCGVQACLYSALLVPVPMIRQVYVCPSQVGANSSDCPIAHGVQTRASGP